jgi:hypothetical protein
MVVEKVLTLSVTGSVTGSIAGAVPLKVKLDSRSKRSLFGLRPKSTSKLGLEGEEGDGCRTEIGDPALSVSVRVGASRR